LAQGEKRWSSGDGDVVKRQFNPVPPKDWDAKLSTTSASIGAGKPEKGGIPYITGVRLVCMNSAQEAGQKDRMVFANIFLSLAPCKDGTLMPDWQNGIKALARALGDPLHCGSMTKTINDAGDEVEYLNPKEVLKYLKDHDGAVLKFHSKMENDANYGPKAVVDYYIESDAGNAFGDDASEEAEEPEEEMEEAPEEEEEPAPVKLVAKKAVSTKGKKR
jgi:hypothetical protein